MLHSTARQWVAEAIHSRDPMKALTCHGAKDVRVETVPDPVIAQPNGILLRVTATANCGSDLHIYCGETPKMEHGDILGHELMGIVE